MTIGLLQMFKPDQIDCVHWPFCLTGVTTGKIDMEFIDRYNITIHRCDTPNPKGTLMFHYPIEWSNRYINADILKNRRQRLIEFKELWLKGLT